MKQKRILPGALALGLILPGLSLGAEEAPRTLLAQVREQLPLSTYELGVQMSYLGYYGRPSNPAGLQWAGPMRTLDDITLFLEGFDYPPERALRYEGLNATGIVERIYQQLLGRAPSAEEAASLVAVIDEQGVETGIGEVVGLILAMTPEQENDARVLASKMTVAQYFTTQMALYGARINGDSLAESLAIMDGIDATDSLADMSAAMNAIDQFVAGYGLTPTTFKRLAVFPVNRNLGADEDPLTETAAEIVTSSADGMTLIYSDSPAERLGFIDITDPSAPQPGGFLPLDGEPTSVATSGNLVLVGLNTSERFTAPSGALLVVDITDPRAPELVTRLPLGGQPDSLAVSPDGLYAAVAIENERDEDACADGTGGLIAEAYGDETLCAELGGELGGLPQLPAGYLVVLEMTGEPADWLLMDVDLRGLAMLAPSDPEPEFVDINGLHQVLVSLQENNHLAVVDAATGSLISDFPASAISLAQIDAVENELIDLDKDLFDLAREPDAIGWVFDTQIGTANEGDLYGGSRGYSLFDLNGSLLYDSDVANEYVAVSIGQFPEFRAENKGAEPEGLEVGVYNGETLMFVGSERANFVQVLRPSRDGFAPIRVQTLPTGAGPEGLLAIPSRELFVVASEVDLPEDGLRSTVSIFSLAEARPEYPQIVSIGPKPLGWGALSALAADRTQAQRLYTVHDSFYHHSRIFVVDVSGHPARIHDEIVLTRDGEFVDYDLEGLATRANGGFWAVSEGRADGVANLLIEVAADGQVIEEIQLPEAISAQRTNSGFEGVAVTGTGAEETVFVAVQRAWQDDPAGYVKIGRYQVASAAWDFFYYPLETAPEGAWVGLSEIVSLDDANRFAIIERDNQQGSAAQIKRIYEIDLASAQDQGLAWPVLDKTLLRDLLPDLAATQGWIPDKVEGLTVAADGQIYVVTDNDGVEDAQGETFFLRLGDSF